MQICAGPWKSCLSQVFLWSLFLSDCIPVQSRVCCGVASPPWNRMAASWASSHLPLLHMLPQDLRWKYTHDPSFQGCPLALLWGLNPSHSPEGPHDWLPQHLTPPALPKLQGHWTTLHLLPKSDLVPPWCLWDGLFPIPGVPASFSLSSQPPRFPWGSPPETELHASSPLCPSQRLYLISDCGGSLLASEHRALKASRGSSALGICLPCRTKSVLFPGGQPTEHSVCAPAEHLPLSWLLFPRGSLPGYSFSSC